MGNPVGLLLLAIVVLFITSIVIRDPKAFAKFVATLAIGFLVGAGVRVLVEKISSTTENSGTAIEVSSDTMYDYSSSVVWNEELACLDHTGFIELESDNFIAKAEALPTVRELKSYIDDS